MLQLWVEDQKLQENPAVRIKNFKVQKSVPQPLTPFEVEEVLGFMRRTYPEPIANYFEFMFFSGLRPEECIALRVNDVLIGAPGVQDSVHVSKAFTAGSEKSTKTHVIRDVLLNGRSGEAVRRQLTLTTALGLKHLFFNPNTKAPWRSEKFQRTLYWYPALQACNVQKRVCYQTRHTFASVSLSAGAEPLWLAGQMGHATPKMIFERYARWIEPAPV